MYKKLAKKLLLGLLTVALLLTTVAVMPANTQAASKKAKKATISAEYKTPNYCLYGQLGFLKKYPVQLKVSEVVSNRNKKATYTFYAEKKKYAIATAATMPARSASSPQVTACLV